MSKKSIKVVLPNSHCLAYDKLCRNLKGELINSPDGVVDAANNYITMINSQVCLSIIEMVFKIVTISKLENKDIDSLITIPLINNSWSPDTLEEEFPDELESHLGTIVEGKILDRYYWSIRNAAKDYLATIDKLMVETEFTDYLITTASTIKTLGFISFDFDAIISTVIGMATTRAPKIIKLAGYALDDFKVAKRLVFEPEISNDEKLKLWNKTFSNLKGDTGTWFIYMDTADGPKIMNRPQETFITNGNQLESVSGADFYNLADN